jgi:hypothetical protein
MTCGSRPRLTLSIISGKLYQDFGVVGTKINRTLYTVCKGFIATVNGVHLSLLYIRV